MHLWFPQNHKEGVPLRHILSRINSVTYNITRNLSSILSPLAGNTPHHIQTIVFLDFLSLFMCIPTSEAVQTIRKCLQQDSFQHTRTNFNPDQICDLMHLCHSTDCHGFCSVPHPGQPLHGGGGGEGSGLLHWNSPQPLV